jgi:DME family drug/metabolite transporter
MTTATLPLDEPAAYRRGVLLVLLAGVVWSTTGLVVRSIEQADAWQILFYRSLGLTVAFLAIALWTSRGRLVAMFARAGWPALVGGVALMVAYTGAIVSFTETTIANAMFLFASAPLFAALLARAIIGEPVRRATWLAMGLAAVGILVMVAEGVAVGKMLGNVAAIASAFGFACFAVTLRWRRTDDPVPSILLAGILASVLAATALAVVGKSLAIPVNGAVLALGLGVFQLAGGFLLLTRGSPHVPAAEITLLSLGEVLLAPVWVWLLYAETPGQWTLVGGVLLLLALVYNALSGGRR